MLLAMERSVRHIAAASAHVSGRGHGAFVSKGSAYRRARPSTNLCACSAMHWASN